eukprot:g2407.t1
MPVVKARLGVAVFISIAAVLLSSLATWLPLWAQTTKSVKLLSTEYDVVVGYGLMKVCLDLNTVEDSVATNKYHECSSPSDTLSNLSDDMKDGYLNDNFAALLFSMLAVASSCLCLILSVFGLSCPGASCWSFLHTISGLAGTLSAGLAVVLTNDAIQKLDTIYDPMIPIINMKVKIAKFSPDVEA